MDRRKFLQMLGLGGAAVVTAPLLPEAPKVEDVPPAMPNLDNYYQRFSEGTIMTSGYLMGTSIFDFDTQMMRWNNRYFGGSA